MHRLFKTLALTTALALPAAAALAETVTITFVQTNDIDRMEEDDGRGGFARLAGVLAAKRAAGTTVFVHSGDTLSPSLLSGIDKGVHMIDILNQMGVDVMVPGNHEFDFGADIFRNRLAEAEFDVVVSNIREPDGSAPANTIDTKIMEFGGIKVGFYGLTTEDTVEVSSPGTITFLDSVETGKAKAAELRAAGVDLVVAVVHTPMAVDMALVFEDAADVVFSGHDEYLMTFFDGAHVVTESYSQADWVVATTVTIDKADNGAVTWAPAFEVINTANVEPDPAIAAVVATYVEKLDAELKVAIGTTSTPLDSRRAMVRGEETAVGNLIADAMRSAVGADVAITNGGGIRADKEYPAGATLTRGDILAELPFGNKTAKLEVTGAQIVAALENGFSQVEAGAGRFPQVSGLSVTYDPTAAPGSRVKSVTIGGAPVDPAKTYVLATNDFMANGGDGYTAFVGAPQLIDAIDAQIMASQVIDYVAAAGTISPAVEGRIVRQ